MQSINFVLTKVVNQVDCKNTVPDYLTALETIGANMRLVVSGKLAGIIIVGTSTPWLAWRQRFTSILILLVFGSAAATLNGLLPLDEMMGDLPLSLLCLAAAVILYEGRLQLNGKEPGEMGRFVFRLVAIACCIFAFSCSERKPEEAVTITIWAHDGQPAEKRALESIIGKFNAQTSKIKAVLQFKQEQGYGNRVNAAAISRSLPDILDVDAPFTAQFAENGLLQSLDDLVPDSVKADFYPATLAQGTYHNKLYTLGAFESTIVLYYNNAHLRACDIAPASSIAEAWSWREFVVHLQTIKASMPELLPLESFMPWGGEWLPYAFLPVVWSNGGSVISESNPSRCTLNSPAVIVALKEWQKLFRDGLADASAPPGRFKRGQAAMAWGIFNRWPLLQEVGIDFGMMPLPGFQRSVSPMGSWRWGITSTSKNQQAAAEVLSWLIDPANGIVPICEANGGIPARMRAAHLMPEFRHTRKLFLDQLEQTARPRPRTPAYGSVSLILSRLFLDVAQGAEVEAAVQQAAAKISRSLERHKQQD